MAENSSAQDFSPFNNQGEEPSKTAYKWGLYAKAVKGFNVDVTYGIKNSNTIGLYFSTVGNPVLALGAPLVALGLAKAGFATYDWSLLTTLLPGKFEILYSDKWDFNFFTNRKMVLGCDNKNTGGENNHCRGKKYEIYDSDLYKFVKGTEYKCEAKGVANLVRIIDEREDFATTVTTFKTEEKNLASKDSKLEAGEAVTITAGSTVTGTGQTGVKFTATTGDAEYISTAGNALLKGATASVEGVQSAELKNNGASVSCAAGKVTISPMLEAGMPGVAVVDVTATLNTLAGDLAAAQAEAAAARGLADVALLRANAAMGIQPLPAP